jgi:hypothetical protein
MRETFPFNSLVCERVTTWKLSVMSSLVICLCSTQNDAKRFKVNKANYYILTCIQIPERKLG